MPSRRTETLSHFLPRRLWRFRGSRVVVASGFDADPAFYESRGTNCASRGKIYDQFSPRVELSLRRRYYRRYLKCRKVVEGLSPLTRGGERCFARKMFALFPNSTRDSKVEICVQRT